MSNVPGQSSASAASPGVAPIVIDLGKKGRKQIKALRKGRPGKLMDKIREALAVLREQGAVAADAQPVIVVVRERPDGPKWLGL